MAQNDLLKRYLDAGMAFTAMTQARAEAIVKDLVRNGEVQADQARDVAAELLERSRRNTEKLLDTVRKEIRDQVSTLGLATQADIARLERWISDAVGGTVKKASARKASGRKAGRRKAGAKKASGTRKKASAKKASVKKASAKKASGTRKKAGAKKASGTRKKAGARKAASRSTKR
jgi:polyhydroxyalkanoate synthesis regulator phasin